MTSIYRVRLNQIGMSKAVNYTATRRGSRRRCIPV